MSNEIDLPEFNIIEKEVTDDGDCIYILELINKPTLCPICGAKLHKHKSITRKVRDLNQFGHQVGLVIKGHRYRCSNKECGSFVGESYESIQEGSQLTNRLRDTIKRESMLSTFKELAELYNVSTSTVAELFKEETAELNKQYKLIAPKVLGIDEVHLKKNYYGVFVNINENRIIEIKENRNKTTVIKFIQSMDDRGNIECVTMDMWKPYKDAVNTVLPNVPVVIDKFHVIKELQKSLDEMRKNVSRVIKEQKERVSLKNNRTLMLKSAENLSSREYEKLNLLLDKYPAFKIPYDLKEAFRAIYDCNSREEAENTFIEWINECHAQGISGYDSFIETVCNWHTEIFNYFDYRYTNAATESLNATIRELDREGRGYAFETLRDKVVLKHLVSNKKNKLKF